MDSIRILHYERWKKLNDKMIGKNSMNIASLGNTASKVEPILNSDGFVKQHIIGGVVKPNDGRYNEPRTSDVKIFVYCAE